MLACYSHCIFRANGCRFYEKSIAYVALNLLDLLDGLFLGEAIELDEGC